MSYGANIFNKKLKHFFFVTKICLTSSFKTRFLKALKVFHWKIDFKTDAFCYNNEAIMFL